MDYSERLENVAVLGAAGKMGSGIVLLVAMEMADQALKPANRSRRYVLHAVDVSHQALAGLQKYLREQVLKAAEKRIVALRGVYADRADLVENGDIVRAVRQRRPRHRPADDHAGDGGRGERHLRGGAREPRPEAEALREDRHRQPEANPGCSPTPRRSRSRRSTRRRGLGGRVMGFHFYNPPAVQKLVELIRGEDDARRRCGVRGDAVQEPAEDRRAVGGRRGLHRQRPLHARPAARDRGSRAAVRGHAVRRGGLLRQPREPGLPGPADGDLPADRLRRPRRLPVHHGGHGRAAARAGPPQPADRPPARAGVRGGQNHDGSQKNGFLEYGQGKPIGVYDPEQKRYVSIGGFQDGCDARLGPAARPGRHLEGGRARPGPRTRCSRSSSPA